MKSVRNFIVVIKKSAESLLKDAKIASDLLILKVVENLLKLAELHYYLLLVSLTLLNFKERHQLQILKELFLKVKRRKKKKKIHHILRN